MRKLNFSKWIGCILLLFSVSSALAWDHGVSLGYGGGSDWNHHTYENSGVFLNADFTTIKEKNWVHITFNGSLGKFWTNEPVNKDLFTAALSLAFRFYPLNANSVHPFFLASVGPAYLSERKFGLNNQAANVAFQSVLGLGAEFGKARRVDLNMRMVHYSNASLMRPNEGFNIFYIVSLGYLF